jgi:hypothetical protein
MMKKVKKTTVTTVAIIIICLPPGAGVISSAILPSLSYIRPS